MAVVSTPPEPPPDERSPLERIVPEVLKRVIESGTKNLNTESLRHLLGDLKLPKESLQYLLTQLDETKHGIQRTVAREVREILERTSLADELAKALSLLTLEVKMEVRFKPSSVQTKVDGAPLSTSVRVKRSNPEDTEPNEE